MFLAQGLLSLLKLSAVTLITDSKLFGLRIKNSCPNYEKHALFSFFLSNDVKQNIKSPPKLSVSSQLTALANVVVLVLLYMLPFVTLINVLCFQG